MNTANNHVLDNLSKGGLKKLLPNQPRVAVGMGTCGIGNGAQDVYEALKQAFKKKGVKADLTQIGCFGFCAQETLVNIYMPGKPLLILNKVSSKDVPAIIRCLSGKAVPIEKVLCKIEKWDHLTHQINYGKDFPNIPHWYEIPFFKGQKKIVLRNCGLINPDDIEEYAAVGGYRSLQMALDKFSPEEVIEEVKKSKLRGRGGAGFPTGRKWELMRQVKADEKYIVCNADEGDPGAYMNRNEIESDPHMLLEGMIIGGYSMGAASGIIYVRAEYPLAVQRLKNAIRNAEKHGILGKNIFNSGFDFTISVVEGAGAFACGEETALIVSLEGKSGRPKPRPPYPAQKGLYGKPTNINNVETWCNIPVIIKKGAEWFAKTGSADSAGTKVFSLVGKIKNTGLVEMPLGSTLETIVYHIGEGTEGGKRIKAVQTGGPSGGCIPRVLFNTPVDYESLASLGAIMGSGGMVVMDEDNCMVDVARYFLEFTTSESCGKCVPCREGLYQQLKTLKSISEGENKDYDLKGLEDLGGIIKDTALCGLGQTGPNPVLTTLRYFRNEYEEHIKEGRCHSGVCEALFSSPCENSCPLHMNIPGFIQLLKEKRIEEAFALIVQDNPLPATTGRVCHHPCEKRCRRIDIDDSITAGEIHRYIADTIYKGDKDKEVFKKLIKKKLPPTGKRIAIIGAGPAGLTGAFYLVRLGHKVTIYEAQDQIGGMMKFTIPEYRLPASVLDREIRNIKSLGIEFIFNTRIGGDSPLKKLRDNFDAVFVSIGAQKEISPGIPGENLKGMLSGIKFLEDISAYRKSCKGQGVVIIGGGNVAIDAARTALRLGSDVTVVYRREKNDMPANAEEIEEAEAEGIKFKFLSAPEKIEDDGKGNVAGIELMKMIPGDFDLSGRRRPVPSGQTYKISCDKVILGIGEKVDSDFVKKDGLRIRKNGMIEVDAFSLQTSSPEIYAGGDAISGPATVTEAMSAAKMAARAIDARLMGKDRVHRLFEKFVYKNIVPIEPHGKKKGSAKKVSIKKRNNNFKEVSLGFSKADIQNETIRCLRCDVKESPRK